jgi:hypothetical protein
MRDVPGLGTLAPSGDGRPCPSTMRHFRIHVDGYTVV